MPSHTEGFVVWFTGLSGAGKSTLASMLAAELRARGLRVELLDGDEVRTHLSKGLGFSREDRDTNVRRIGFVAKLVARAGAVAITAAISPYRKARGEVRASIPEGRFFEVYCEASVENLAGRDPKGLYKRALAGEIKHFTGVDDPYEPPESPEIRLSTDREPPGESLARIVERLEAEGRIPARGGLASAAGGALRRRLPAPHGGELREAPLLEGEEEAEATRAGAEMRAVSLSGSSRGELLRLVGGSHSPLVGFMNEKDYRKVLGEGRLESGLPFALPVLLPLGREEASGLRPGERARLAAGAGGRTLGEIEIESIFPADPELEARALGAPLGAALYASGLVRGFDRALAETVGRVKSARRTRLELERSGAKRATSLAPRALFDRGDELLARMALVQADLLWIRPALEDEAASALPFTLRLEAARAAAAYLPGSAVGIEPLAFPMAHAAPRAPEALRARAFAQLAIAGKNSGFSLTVLDLGDLSEARVEDLLALAASPEVGAELLAVRGLAYSRRAGEVLPLSSWPDWPGEDLVRGPGVEVGGRELAALEELLGSPDAERWLRPEVAALARAHFAGLSGTRRGKGA